MAAGGTFNYNPIIGLKQADTTVTGTALLVALSGDHTVVLAGVADDPIGVSYQCDSLTGFGTANEQISVMTLRPGAIVPMTASAAVTQNAKVYRAASGKVSSTAVGKALGVALEAASGNGSVIQVLVDSHPCASDPHKIVDPGNAGAIPVTKSGVCNLTSVGGGETRTLAIPQFDGQRLALCCDVDGGGIAITVASSINQAGNTVITMNDVDDFVELLAVRKAGVLRWQTVISDGVALS